MRFAVVRWMVKNDYFINKTRIRQSLNQFSIVSLNINRILLSFIFYSFAGWIIETCFILFITQKLISRGWVQYGLPLIPLYGVCCLVLIKLLAPLKKKPLIIFSAAVCFTTISEYSIGLALTKIFHHILWSYSNLPFSIQGIISLPISFGWGILSLLMIYVIDPNLKRMINRVPVLPAALISWSIMTYSVICACIYIYNFFY
jgi:uncharacterized membrane protein